MGKKGISKDTEREQHFYLSKCNDCEHDIRLSSEWEITPEQIEELQKRILCPDCLNKKLGVKKK